MDFFYVKDVLPVLKSILSKKIEEKEINLVYKEKRSLISICNTINRLSNYQVPVQVNNFIKGSDYYGDGELLNNLKLNIEGFESGLEKCYQFMLRSGN